jgi:hypothetical protein
VFLFGLPKISSYLLISSISGLKRESNTLFNGMEGVLTLMQESVRTLSRSGTPGGVGDPQRVVTSPMRDHDSTWGYTIGRLLGEVGLSWHWSDPHKLLTIEC